MRPSAIVSQRPTQISDPVVSTTTVIPSGKSNRVRSAKLLNPASSSAFSMRGNLQRDQSGIETANGTSNQVISLPLT